MSKMGSAQSTRLTVGIVGNVISGGLFLSPIPTFRKIWKKKDVEGFDAKPYIATVLNCLLWCYYGMPFVNPNNILVVSINGFGLVIELVYLAMYSYFAQKKGQKTIRTFFGWELLFFGAFVATTMLAIPQHKMYANRHLRAFVVGCFCNVFNIIMYVSPLFIVKDVIKKKSAKYKTPWLSLVNFLNGVCWTSYALIGKVDYFILVSNGLGAILGAIQLIIWMIYRKGTPNNEELEDKPQLPAIELQPDNKKMV